MRLASVLLVSVCRYVMLGSFLGVMMHVHVVTVRRMCVVGGLMMAAGLVVFGGLQMMFGRLGVMLCGLTMVFCSFLRHCAPFVVRATAR